MSRRIQVIGAPWCTKCGPFKDALKVAGIEFEELSADDDQVQQLMASLGIRGVPATLILVDDNVPKIITGSKVKDVVEALDD